mgnify:CR=1 FL=1
MAGASGLLAGLLYRSNFLGLQRLRLPAAVVDLFSATVGRVLSGPGPQQQVFVTPTAAQLQAQQAQQHAAEAAAFGGGRPAAGGAAPRGGGATRRAAAAAEPSPEAVQQLVAMGFDQGQAAAALRQTGNNVEAALQYLL